MKAIFSRYAVQFSNTKKHNKHRNYLGAPARHFGFSVVYKQKDSNIEFFLIKMEELYIAALDVGTTSVRCHIVNSRYEVISVASCKIELLYPEAGFVEINPDKLWQNIKNVISESIKKANLTPGQISCIGLSTLRSTFITWNKITGEPFHNFITWKDLRANNLVNEWNSSFIIKILHLSSYLMYLITRNKRYFAASVIRFTNPQITLRLLWMVQNNTKLNEAIKQDNARFGTIESWLIYKLTAGKVHVTDISNASATGFFDPFICEWSTVMLKLLKLPIGMLPKVVDNVSKDFSVVDRSIFGAEIPIICSLADQSASLFGSSCFEKGDLKITLGTGGFLNITTGSNPYPTVSGVYPLVGWQIGNEPVFVAEGATNDVGSIVEWMLNINLILDPKESSEIAESVTSSDGVYFVPAFSGLGAPVNDSEAATGFIGIKPTTTKACMVRAVLESIVFRLVQLYDVVKSETNIHATGLRVDGGVSRNDFICQLLADMTNLPVERTRTSEVTTLGVIYLSAYQLGLWKSCDDIKKLIQIDRVFTPNCQNAEKYESVYQKWLLAIDRFKNWYQS